MAAFVPLLEAKRTHLWKIPRKTFKYGETERHKVCTLDMAIPTCPTLNKLIQLDIYYPLEPPANGKTPILFFIYGGGFNSGDRRLPDPFSLGYACLGAYFAQRGFLTVIPDYRLIPNVQYPAPAEDVRDAMVWVIQNSPKLTSRGVPNPDTNSLFLMGHSAGAVHAATTVFHPELLMSTTLEPRLKGIILNAGGYHFHPVGLKMSKETEDLCNKYWGSVEATKTKDPLALFQAASEEKLASLPEVLLVEAEREPPWMAKVGEDFWKALEARYGREVKKIFGKGHNHISPNWALSTGQGEEWAEEVVEWMNGKLAAANSATVELATQVV